MWHPYLVIPNKDQVWHNSLNLKQLNFFTLPHFKFHAFSDIDNLENKSGFDENHNECIFQVFDGMNNQLKTKFAITV